MFYLFLALYLAIGLVYAASCFETTYKVKAKDEEYYVFLAGSVLILTFTWIVFIIIEVMWLFLLGAGKLIDKLFSKP
jgi:hypothetical protein